MNQPKRLRSAHVPRSRLWLIATLSIALWVMLTPWGMPQAIAQSVKIEEIWQQVYQQLPNFPQENQYVSKETGKVAPNNNLVSRLIQYHMNVKGRTPNYRLDWKLTLADYLDANELILEESYPGSETLQQNPYSNDRAAIGRLNRKQRDALVQSLVNVFNRNFPTQSTATPTPQPTASPTPSPEAQPQFIQPQPGDAQLLL